MNIFALIIIALFIMAGIAEHLQGNVARASFYYLSAAINVNVIFLK